MSSRMRCLDVRPFSGTRRVARGRLLVGVWLALSVGLAGMAPADPPAEVTLEVGFEGSLIGAAGEVPLTASGVTFESGVEGQAGVFGSPNEVTFTAAGNLDPTSGSLRFWIQPSWAGTDVESRWVLRHGGLGGLLVGRDGAGYWRIILNRWGGGGQPELGAGVSIADWSAGEWHHAAFNWSADALEVFVDGERVQSVTPSFAPPPVADAAFWLGSDAGGGALDAALDELVITDAPLTEEEVLTSYLSGITVSSLSFDPSSVSLFETWWYTPGLLATTDHGVRSIPPDVASWSSADPTIAAVDPSGRLVALSEGLTTITADFQGATAHLPVEVVAPVLSPREDPVPTDLATPAAGALYDVPVVILRYLPTLDGVDVDSEETGWSSTLAALESRIESFDRRVKFMLEEGSRFRGYADDTALPSLGYRVVRVVTVFEPFPRGFEVGWSPGIYRPDYNQILDRFDARHWVEDVGVREFWIWGYHHGDIEPAESNMSSPVTGDISNSERYADDLPIFRRSYTVYNYNFTRSQAEAVHNHGHQLEAILAWADQRQNGNTELFLDAFVGMEQGQFVTGRCGWTHMPPNTTVDYDYENSTLVSSDCEDWTPDGSGATQLLNADTWGSIDYPWPGAEPVLGRTESQFYIYWMQNMPGWNNSIAHGFDLMTNWWFFSADWDRAVLLEHGLFGGTQSPAPALFWDDFEWGDADLWSSSVGTGTP